MRNRSFASALLVLSLLGTATGQQPTPSPAQAGQDKSQQEDVVRVTTNLVQVDVVVTDKEGRQVTDLRPEDFEISEAGKRQQITHFSYIAAAPSAADQAPTATAAAPAKGAPVAPAVLRREQVRRTIALVVDDLGLSFESIGFVRQALKKFVDEQMQPNDLVAILRTSSGTGASQHFTSDKRQLYAAIQRVSWYPQGRSGLSPAATLNEATVGSDQRDTAQYLKEMEEARAGLYSVGTFNSISSIVRGLGEMPGRKSLVLISEAFQLFTTQGRNVQLIDAMQRLTEQANAASVSIYTMDAAGVQVDMLDASDNPAARSYVFPPEVLALASGSGMRPSTPPLSIQRADSLSAQAQRDSGDAFRRLNAMMDQRREERMETHTVLSYLASKTGGLFLRNRNDLGGAMQRIMDDQRGYYLIGYRPEDASLDAATGRPRMHNISIKVKRSGLNWRTRAGYFGVRDDERRARPRTREEQLTEALLSPFASGDVHVRLTSLFGTEPATGEPAPRTFIRSLLHVDAHDLSFKEEAGGARTTELEMVVVAFGDRGQVIDQASYQQPVRAANEQEYQRLLENGLVYILNFPIKTAGAYQMRVAVRDSSSERMGTATQFIEVPDLTNSRLALSGLVLSGLEPTKTAATAAGANAQAEPNPQTGPAVRRLRQGMMLEYRYNIYNAKLDAAGQPQIQTQMRILREGQPVFTGKLMPLDASRQSDMKRLTAVGRLRVGPELVPGQYVLQVTVTDALAPARRQTATQWIDFEVVN